MANKALHLTAIPLRSISAGELERYLQKTTNSAPECSVEKKWQKPNQKDDK